jgi:hypothetical protein
MKVIDFLPVNRGTTGFGISRKNKPGFFRVIGPFHFCAFSEVEIPRNHSILTEAFGFPVIFPYGRYSLS